MAEGLRDALVCIENSVQWILASLLPSSLYSWRRLVLGLVSPRSLGGSIARPGGLHARLYHGGSSTSSWGARGLQR